MTNEYKQDLENLRQLLKMIEEADTLLCDKSCICETQTINDIYLNHYKMLRLLRDSLTKDYIEAKDIYLNSIKTLGDEKSE